MLLKIIGFLLAAIPVVLFLRAIFFRRPNRISAAFAEFEADRSRDHIFLGIVGVVVTVALGKIVWTWWTQF